MFCTECGQQSSEGQFCTSCGSKLQQPSIAAPIESSSPSAPGIQGTFNASSNFQSPMNGKKVGLSNPAVKFGLIGAGAVALISTIFLFSGGANPLPGAVSSCGLNEDLGIQLADGDKTLIIDTMGEEDFIGTSYADSQCVLDALNIPERIQNRIDKTRALDGQLEDSWDGLSISWSYHPDSGADYTISRE